MYNQKSQIFFLLDSHTHYGQTSSLHNPKHKKNGLSLGSLPEIKIPKRTLSRFQKSHLNLTDDENFNISRLNVAQTQPNSKVTSIAHTP